jgi:hypothetical protein
LQTEIFQSPVPPDILTHYREYVFFPMYLGKIKEVKHSCMQQLGLVLVRKESLGLVRKEGLGLVRKEGLGLVRRKAWSEGRPRAGQKGRPRAGQKGRPRAGQKGRPGAGQNWPSAGLGLVSRTGPRLVRKKT